MLIVNRYDFIVLQLSDTSDSNCYVKPVSNEKTDHVRKLVKEQKPSQKNSSRRSGENYGYRGPASHNRRFKRQRPILNNDFKKDVYKLLINYPNVGYFC